MNTEIIIIFLPISLIGMFIFWLVYQRANNTSTQAQKHLLTELKDKTLSDDDRQKYEKQLSDLLQKNKTGGSFKITAVLASFLTVSSFVLYYNLGTPNAKAQLVTANKQSTNQEQAPQMSMQDAVVQLEQRLAENPDDVDGQMLYARSQISMKQYDKAVTAYRKANTLSPNEAVILTEFAQAIALANNSRSFLGEPEGLLTQAIELEPTNQKALWLLGMTFYEKKNLTKTNELWSKLYDLMSNDEAKKQLAGQLADVRSQLGVNSPTKAPNSSNTVTDAANTLITLQINLDELLIDNLTGKRALLYVYTKETSGMPMPIAVIRKPLEEINKTFPITLSLSDDDNLQPNRKLSNFVSIIVGARISFTGNAMPREGDLQSTEVKVDLADDVTIELLIDKVR